ncbi:exodeoxyribonuclease VII large subunit [uncultured Eubacterium sp.]|uniref:exodeoxyribonuclease VII large subunit n=1 Tax=uncultured Eubacterium sp. TaxID=165185 RepID=UPI0025FDA7D6|nr:exodeoxyribonuclease VII large subunit [uncultured Eubacterium sp.]
MTTLTVSQINRYIKSLFDEIPPIQNIYVMGEISNFKHYRQSGHMYFTLKDSSSQLKCVMFATDNYKLKFIPKDGMNVVCFGQIGVYERDGVYQLYVRDIQPKGAGDLAVAFEQLKAKLAQKGYFDEELKKPIPMYPQKIGVATSNMGAAVEDIKNVISRRYPLCEIIIVPTVVQGEAASKDIASSVKFLDKLGVDTIIVGRGGGSIEDLWAFNTEEVADAIYNCKTPIISAVGHETDFTICDFVADLRAPTPSAAAELAVPDINNEYINLQGLELMLDKNIENIVQGEEARLDYIMNKSPLADIDKLFDFQTSVIENYEKNIRLHYETILKSKAFDLKKNAAMLDALSPLAVIGRGYTITEKDGIVLTDVSNANVGDSIVTKFKNGTLVSEITEVKNNGN